MAQDMKAVLHVVRWTCYSRVARRVLHEQGGWIAGLGAADCGLSAAIAIQQAKQMGHDLYMLWIDLATFFPSIDRGNLRASELWNGVPEEVKIWQLLSTARQTILSMR